MLKAKSKAAKPRRAKPKTSALAKAQAKAKARHERLLQYARAHRPPQSWFEQNDVPFQPKRG
jgi:hypothetical protein